MGSLRDKIGEKAILQNTLRNYWYRKVYHYAIHRWLVSMLEQTVIKMIIEAHPSNHPSTNALPPSFSFDDNLRSEIQSCYKTQQHQRSYFDINVSALKGMYVKRSFKISVHPTES